MSRSEVEENCRLSKTSLHIPYLKLYQFNQSIIGFFNIICRPVFYSKQRFGDIVQP
jgi:hypothetical protein